MSGKRSIPLASQDSEEDTSSDYIPNTPKEKRLCTPAAPQLRASSSAIKPVDASTQRKSKEDMASDSSPSDHHSLESPPPKNKESEKNVVRIGVEEDGKKPLFQRVFSEEDEIVLLEGLFRFIKKGHVDGHVNMVGFHQFIKGSFPIEIAKHQLSDKIKRLRKRFRKNQGRAIKSDSHESRIFDISNKIWGDKELKKEKSILPCDQSYIYTSDFATSDFADFKEDILAGLDECEPSMKKKLIDLKIRQCKLRILFNLLENKKIEFHMDQLNSHA